MHDQGACITRVARLKLVTPASGPASVARNETTHKSLSIFLSYGAGPGVRRRALRPLTHLSISLSYGAGAGLEPHCGLTCPPTTSTEPSGRTTLLQNARLAAIGASGCTCAWVPYAPIVTCVHGATALRACFHRG